VTYKKSFKARMKQLADKYDNLPSARLTGKVCQNETEEDSLAEAFLASLTAGSIETDWEGSR
jgi:hypothetical protein